jgi:mitochondrial import receptor subunit TOM20
MARAAKEEAEAEGAAQREEIKKAVNAAKDEGFPTDLEEKEAYFMSQVAKGESLCAEGSSGIAQSYLGFILTSFPRLG